MTKKFKLAILMDPIADIDINHDSSFAMMLEAQQRGWDVFYFQMQDMYYQNETVFTKAHPIRVQLAEKFFTLEAKKTFKLTDFNVVLQRKDPPFNIDYIYTTYLLELAQKHGAHVVNDPRSLRDCNEKMFTLQFPHLCPATVVSSDKEILKQFWQTQQEIILKPLDGMGGRGIFHVSRDERNINSIIETLTHQGQQYIMAQTYIPAIRTAGDKRIFIVDGIMMPYCLQRLPATDDIRGNMVAGASINVLPITEQEKNIGAELGSILRDKGLLFVGLDVIGGWVTEINVTSPTGAQEIHRASGCDIIAALMDSLAERFT